jgi:hypothetical protein
MYTRPIRANVTHLARTRDAEFIVSGDADLLAWTNSVRR